MGVWMYRSMYSWPWHTSWRWVVSFTPRQLYPKGKSPWHHWIGWVSSRTSWMTLRREKSCPYWDLNSIPLALQPVANHCTDCCILVWHSLMIHRLPKPFNLTVFYVILVKPFDLPLFVFFLMTVAGPYTVWDILSLSTVWFTQRRPQINNCKSWNNLPMKITLGEFYLGRCRSNCFTEYVEIGFPLPGGAYQHYAPCLQMLQST
jgi:hypothetical protein